MKITDNGGIGMKFHRKYKPSMSLKDNILLMAVSTIGTILTEVVRKFIVRSNDKDNEQKTYNSTSPESNDRT